MLRSHAAAIRRWAVLLNTRLHDRTATGDGLPSRPALTENGLATLAVRARPLVRPVADICLREYPAAQRVLDVGGGHGEFALEFARRGLEVTVQDLPEVVKIARRRGRLPAGGVELFAGDAFTTLPQGPFDLVLCSAVTNMFDADADLELYLQLRPLIGSDGGLAIVSYPRGRNAIAAAFAPQMVARTDGGDAHGEDDYRRWLAEAGYGPVQTHELDDPPQTVILAGR